MNDQWYRRIGFGVVLLISIVCIYYMYRIRSNLAIDNAITRAINYSEFSPTHFRIYDKSTDTICNRLIVIEPFNWYLWAANGELFILNPESSRHCTHNTTPAVQVLEHQFIELCLTMNFDSVVSSYTQNTVPVLIEYEINSERFTIVDAINLLMKSWIKFEPTSMTVVTSASELKRSAALKSGIKKIDLTLTETKQCRSCNTTTDNENNTPINARNLAQMMNQIHKLRVPKALKSLRPKIYNDTELQKIYANTMKRYHNPNVNESKKLPSLWI